MNSRLPATLRALLLATAASLVACGGAAGPEQVAGPAAPTVATWQVAASGGEGGLRLFDGRVEAVEQATLTAQTQGRVVALEHDVDDPVTRGSLILRLSGVEQRAQLEAARQALVEAQALAVEAAATFERSRSVYERRLVPKADLDRAAAGHQAAEARLAAARAAVAAAQETFSYTELRAPFAGVVTRRYVEVGEAIAPGQPLVSIAALGRLRVHVDVPQDTAAGIKALGRATLYLPDGQLESSELTVFPSAAERSNTVRVRIELPAGAEGLYPGMLLKAGFAVSDAGVMAIPSTAVLQRSELTAVYVLSDSGELNLRQVRLGRQQGDQVEVLAGLQPGERIALDPVAATLAYAGR